MGDDERRSTGYEFPVVTVGKSNRERGDVPANGSGEEGAMMAGDPGFDLIALLDAVGLGGGGGGAVSDDLGLGGQTEVTTVPAGVVTAPEDPAV